MRGPPPFPRLIAALSSSGLTLHTNTGFFPPPRCFPCIVSHDMFLACSITRVLWVPSPWVSAACALNAPLGRAFFFLDESSRVKRVLTAVMGFPQFVHPLPGRAFVTPQYLPRAPCRSLSVQNFSFLTPLPSCFTGSFLGRRRPALLT